MKKNEGEKNKSKLKIKLVRQNNSPPEENIEKEEYFEESEYDNIQNLSPKNRPFRNTKKKRIINYNEKKK